ncbi:unnamed protein product, partial [Ceratitis capitata]
SGCDAVYLDKKPGKTKLLPKGHQCTFVGMRIQLKCISVYIYNSDKSIVISRDVIFFEKSFANVDVSESGDEFAVFDVTSENPMANMKSGCESPTTPESEVIASSSSSEVEEQIFVGAKR